jgi:hypothetical protein
MKRPCATCHPCEPPGPFRGKQAEVPISGQNARRTLFATVDLRNGRRVVMVSRRQKLSDYHRFLRRLRAGLALKARSGCCWTAIVITKAPAAYA